MPVIDLRELVSFPGGDNSSDTVIGGVHFNLTTLENWNYTLYSNGTLSNSSWCLLTFEPYTPSLVYPNGSFANVTWCYSPVNPIGERAGIGLGFAAAFGLVLLLTLVNLGKHGKLHLPAETRFRPVGRRWQWYWAVIVCAFALISLLTDIDVDRYYLPELPIVLTSFFWLLMLMSTMACVWESVRHWGSWKERQFIDPNPFVFRHDDTRSMVEFWLPLFFYLWFWICFFMVVPRNWGSIEEQRYPEQTLTVAAPTATDWRFKTAAFCLFVCWLTTIYSLRHSVQHYCARNRGFLNRAFGLLRYTPPRFFLILPLALVVPAYQALAAWSFQWSPLNVEGSRAAIYAGGYAPSLLILLINGVSGLFRPNEDRELLRQRRLRGDELDREIGLIRKPAWWRRVNGEVTNPSSERMRDRIARNVRELGGGKPTARNLDAAVEARLRAAEIDNAAASANAEAVEMRPMPSTTTTAAALIPDEMTISPGDFEGAHALASRYAGRSDRRRTEHTMQTVASLLFPDGNPNGVPMATAQRRADLLSDGPPPYSEQDRGRLPGQERPQTAGRSNSTGTTNSITAPPQQVRSMLDV